ncbi:hypothetical protein N0V82_003892 [Gnomoniopsis sp. IMI 355080]|nr:hypothetical protein N0V82_003892 [Gnomoniopsis sp. IMI 355080]
MAAPNPHLDGQVLPVQTTAVEKESPDLGILETFPPEVRLMIYREFFSNSNPTAHVKTEYETGSDPEKAVIQIICHGHEILYTSKTICKEASEEFWPYVTTISASRTIPGPSSSETATATAVVEGRPIESLPVSLAVLVNALPSLAKAHVLHLRNVALPAHGATTLLAEFPKLETLEFNVYRDGFVYQPKWNLRSQDAIMKHGVHNDFNVYPELATPQEWLKLRHGIDVVDDPAMGKIRFLKRAIEKRRPYFGIWSNIFPPAGPANLGGGMAGDDAAVLSEGSPPLANAFLDFTIGKSYARDPTLPDEDGFQLVMSWEEPKPSASSTEGSEASTAPEF